MSKLYFKTGAVSSTVYLNYPAMAAFCFLATIMPFKIFAQAPTVSYPAAPTYNTGQSITPLAPSASGVAANGYSSPVLLGPTVGIGFGVAVDAAGDIFETDYGGNQVYEIRASDGATVTISSALSLPRFET